MKKSLLLSLLLVVTVVVLSVLHKVRPDAASASAQSSERREIETVDLPLDGAAAQPEVSVWQEIGGQFEDSFNNLTQIRVTSITGNYYLSDSDVLEQVREQGLQFIWDARPELWNERLALHPWIDSADVNFSFFPTAAKVEVREAAPWLVWQTAERSWLISRAMRIVEPLETVNEGNLVMELSRLPRIIADSSDRAALKQGLLLVDLLELAGGLPFEAARFNVEADGLAVEPALSLHIGTVRIAAADLEEAKTKLKQLRAVIGDLQQRGERAEEIDLRVRGQVIVRKVEAVLEDRDDGDNA